MYRTDLYIPFHDSDGKPLQTALVVCQPEVGPLVLQAFLRNAPYLVILLFSCSDVLEVIQDIQPDVLFVQSKLVDGNAITLYDFCTKTLMSDVPTVVMGVMTPEEEDEIIKRHIERLEWQSTHDSLFAALKNIFVRSRMLITQM